MFKKTGKTTTIGVIDNEQDTKKDVNNVQINSNVINKKQQKDKD